MNKNNEGLAQKILLYFAKKSQELCEKRYLIENNTLRVFNFVVAKAPHEIIAKRVFESQNKIHCNRNVSSLATNQQHDQNLRETNAVCCVGRVEIQIEI